MKITIENDTFFVSDRIKEIESNYFIVYDTQKQKYEVHYKGQEPDTYCLTLPFDELDSRTVDYVFKTQISKAKELFDEMERENDKLIKREQKRVLEQSLKNF